MLTEKKRPQLSLDELHQVRWFLGGLLTLISVWTVFYLDIEAWMLMGVTTVAVLACLLRPTLPSSVAGFVHVLAFPAVVGFFFVDLWVKGEVLPAIVRLDILLLLYRGTSYRHRREDLQIIVLGLFLVVVAGVLTVSLLFAVQILAFAACALSLLLVITLIQAAEDGTNRANLNALLLREAPSWAHVKWGRLFERVRQAMDWRVAALGGVLFVGVVGVSALLFVSLPRFQLQNSLFLERFIVRKAKTGFSDSIKIGDVTEIQQDTSVALSIDVPDRTLLPSSPYWRMLVLEKYQNGTFKASDKSRPHWYASKIDSEINGTVLWKAGEPVYWTFYLEAEVSRFLPLPGPFNQLVFTERRAFRFAPPLGLVELRDDPVSMVAYRVEGLELSDKFADSGFLDSWRRTPPQMRRVAFDEMILGVNESTDGMRLRQIDDEILARTSRKPVSAAEFSALACAWLRQNHGYSLTPQMPPGPGDPLVRWLDSRATGHCELFAGSLVLLARAAGYPARVVTGFHGGTWNSYSNNLTLRNSDAHAWAEIFDETTGKWLRADALAAATDSGRAAERAVRTAVMDRGWSARIESLRIFWYRRVVSFDRRSQLETLQAVKEATEGSGRYVRAMLKQAAMSIRSWAAKPWDAKRIGGFIGIILGAAALVWAWRDFGRNAWRRFLHGAGARREDPIRADASRWLARLAATEQGTEEKIAVTAELQRLRFGARPTWPPPDRVFRRARRVVRESRRRRIARFMEKSKP